MVVSLAAGHSELGQFSVRSVSLCCMVYPLGLAKAVKIDGLAKAAAEDTGLPRGTDDVGNGPSVRSLTKFFRTTFRPTFHSLQLSATETPVSASRPFDSDQSQGAVGP